MASLKHLLAAGSSITGLRNAVAPYKVADQNFLSRLGPLALGGQRGFPGGVSPGAKPDSDAKVQERVARVPGRNGVEISTGEVVQATAVPPARDVAQATARPAWSVRSLLSFTFFRTDRANSRGRRMVQTELSMENVKVVRNDLMEADLEVVECTNSVDSGLVKVSHGGRAGGGEASPRWVNANWLSAPVDSRTVAATTV
jgi:hypothetical protein